MPIAEVGFTNATSTSASQLLVSTGPTIFVDIGFDEAFDHSLNVPPKTLMQQVWALVDTGATESCIDDGLARELNLPLVDTGTASGIGGSQQCDVYLAQLHVPALGFTQYGRFMAVHLALGGQKHRALIGRSFLQTMMLIYDGRTGNVQICR